jgi:hydroxyacylglutathione hydrolase
MKIERFEVPGLAQYSYVVSDNGEAVVIDAIRDVDRYTDYAASQGLKIANLVETHIHADFASGSIALAEATGAELALSAYDKGEHYRYAMPHRALQDGEGIEVGSVRLQALHTPGHTPEHLSFVLFDAERGANEPLALFSGDFLFVGSLGRPDLLGDEAKQGLAHELFRSLHERIPSLPDSVQVYPGHGAGSLCGSGMSDRAESTLGYERATNHLFRLAESAFVEEILASVPPMPVYYPRMKALNSEGAPSVSTLPGGRSLLPSEVAALSRQEDVVLLDLRRPEAFGGAHIPGAINIGAGQNLSLWAGWLLDPDKRIVLVGESGDDEASRRSLVRVGLDRIEGFLAQGMPAWIDAGMGFARTTQLSTHEVERHSSESLIVDVRSNKEWAEGHIAGARHIMLGELTRSCDKLPVDRPIIAVCGSGYRSSIAASLLARNGFSDVSSMGGGMSAWNQQDLPLSLD